MRAISFASRVLAVFALSALVLFALAASTWMLATEASRSTRHVAHTYAVLLLMSRTQALTTQIELSTQSFRISADPARLQERDEAIAVREQVLAEMRSATADVPEQQKRWQDLRRLIDQRLAVAHEVERLRKSEGQPAADAFVAQAGLAHSRQQSSQVLAAMQATELQLLKQSEQEQSRLRGNLLLSALGLSAVLALLVGGSFVLLRRQLRENERSLQKLADSEEELAACLDSMPEAVLLCDTEQRIRRINTPAARLLGLSQAQAAGRLAHEVLELVDEDRQSRVELHLSQVLNSDAARSPGEHLLLLRSGQEQPLEVAVSMAPVLNAQARVRGLVLVLRDSSDSRRAERLREEQLLQLEQHVQERTAALRESEAHLRSVISNVPALIAYVDHEQRYVYANERYLQCYAAGQADITGASVRSVLGEQRYLIAAPRIERVLQGEAQNYDWEPFPEVWQAVSYVPRSTPAGAVEGYYVLGTEISERRRTELALQASQQQLARVIEGSDLGYWEWDLRSNRFEVSARWESMLGYQPGELDVDPDNWAALVHPDDLPQALASIERHLSGAAASHAFELRARTKQGEWRWILTRGAVVARDAQGQALLMSGTHTDVHERKRLEFAQREASIVFENSYEGIMVADGAGLITKINPAFTRITGYTADEVLGRSPRLLSSGRHDVQFYRDFWQTLEQQGSWRGEIWNRRKNGEIYAALQSVTAVRDAKGEIRDYVSVFNDISQRKAHEAELSRVANFDPLTQLPNRRLLSDRLAQAISRADRVGKFTAICFLDLDGFKAINDQNGHEVGDQLLIGVAENLKSVLRANDTLSRLGGDEFVILLADFESPEECAQVLERLLGAVQQPVVVDERVLSISASVGVSIYPLDHADPDTLLRHADQAMYLAKQGGRNRYQLFDTEIDRRAQTHREQLGQLRQALELQQFQLHYQPKVDLSSGAVLGVEALIRWQHPQRGLLAPGEFLSHLQGSELEGPVGEWVIEQALGQMEKWRSQGLRLPISVNISAQQLLQTGFCEVLDRLLALHPNIAPGDLELEVLESSAISEMERAVAALQRCMRLGVHFALDDFGTGYSSLTYLRKLPVATLKIDQSFVRDMLVDPDDLSIVKGVIELARAFNRQVIAEGVETLGHGAALLAMGCKRVQGYGIARPMPPAQIPPWREQWLTGEAWLALERTASLPG